MEKKGIQLNPPQGCLQFPIMDFGAMPNQSGLPVTTRTTAVCNLYYKGFQTPHFLLQHSTYLFNRGTVMNIRF